MTSESVSDRVSDLREDIADSRGGRIGKVLLVVLAIYVVICLMLGW